jgi:hypothetical protein
MSPFMTTDEYHWYVEHPVAAEGNKIWLDQRTRRITPARRRTLRFAFDRSLTKLPSSRIVVSDATFALRISTKSLMHIAS